MPEIVAPFLNAVYLTGPTAVGKSEISLLLAERLDAEIIALDAMTLYQGMDIGTAKPSAADRKRIPHHLLDTVSPQQLSNLDQYLVAAAEVVRDLAQRGKTALFVGGSPLYLKACLRGLSELPAPDDDYRAELHAQAAAQGVESLHARLAGVDPAAAAKIASTDLRRIVRSLEIYKATGQPPSQLRQRHDQLAPAHVPVIALVRDRPQLYQRINQRVEEMFAQGLAAEAAALPRPLSQTALQAVGYAEAFAYNEGTITLAQAIEQTQLRTRHYAKHQMTWFRNLKETRGLRIQDRSVEENVERLADQIQAIRQGEPCHGDPVQ